MIRVHPIHDRARVVVERGHYADDHVLEVQVLDESGQWVSKGVHLVSIDPQSEAADLAAEFSAVSEARVEARIARQDRLEDLRRRMGGLLDEGLDLIEEIIKEGGE